MIDQSVTWLCYAFDVRRIMVRFLNRRRFSLSQSVQTGSRAHLAPAPYLCGNSGSFPSGRAARHPGYKDYISQTHLVYFKNIQDVFHWCNPCILSLNTSGWLPLSLRLDIQFIVKVKNEWSHIITPKTPSWRAKGKLSSYICDTREGLHYSITCIHQKLYKIQPTKCKNISIYSTIALYCTIQYYCFILQYTVLLLYISIYSTIALYCNI
jgi:hypothetical protein